MLDGRDWAGGTERERNGEEWTETPTRPCGNGQVRRARERERQKKMM